MNRSMFVCLVAFILSSAGCNYASRYRVNLEPVIADEETTYRLVPVEKSNQSHFADKAALQEKLGVSDLDEFMEGVTDLEAGQTCAVTMQLFYRSDGEHDSLISNKRCVLIDGEVTFEPITSSDFKLFNLTRDAKRILNFKRRHLCVESDREDVCTWNGGVREHWPLSIRFESPSKISRSLGAAKIYLNGALRHHQFVPSAGKSFVIGGENMIGKFMPHQAPVSIRLVPASNLAIARELAAEIGDFEQRRRSALSIMGAVLKKQVVASESGLAKNSRCMAIHSQLVYMLMRGLTSSPPATEEFNTLKEKWNATCEGDKSLYGNTLATQTKCWEATSPFSLESLENAELAMNVKGSTLLSDRLDPSLYPTVEIAAQEDMLESALAEIGCAEKTALLALHDKMLSRMGDLRRSLDAFYKSASIPPLARAILETQWARTKRILEDDALDPNQKALAIRDLHEQLLVARASALRALPGVDPAKLIAQFEALEEEIEATLTVALEAKESYDSVKVIASQIDGGVKAILSSFRDIKGQAVAVVTSEEEALIAYQSFAAELPDQKELFVDRKDNPPPLTDVTWLMDAKHLDPAQFFTLSTWNAVPIAPEGTAYVDPIDVSTAIPIVDLIGYRQLYTDKLDVRAALGVVLYQEQLLVPLSDTDDFELSYINPGGVLSLGLNSFRLGGAYVVRDPLDSRFTELDEFEKLKVGEEIPNADALFGSRGVRNIRIFVGVDLFKLITNNSTGTSFSAEASQ